MLFTGFTWLSVLLLFPLATTFFVFMHGFNPVSSNIDEVLSINLSANVFVFGDFNIHLTHWLAYSGGTDRPGEHCYDFCISNDVTQMVNFHACIPDCDSHSSTLLDFYLLALVFVLQWCSLYWEILIMLFSFHWLSVKLKTGCPISLYSLWLFFCWYWWSLWWFERSSMGRHL